MEDKKKYTEVGKIIPTHSFFSAYKDKDLLYCGCKTMGSWISRVAKIAKKIETDPSLVPFVSTKTVPKDIANDFRGSAFEGFGEIFINSFGVMPQIGIRQYKPYGGKDYGVDGVGIGNNGHVCSVQFKFRTEYDKVLKGDKDHLHNFVNQSWNEVGVNRKDTENMLILTTGKEVDYRDMGNEWNNKVRYIALNQSWGCFKRQKYRPQNPTNIFSLRSLVDGNLIFWIMAHDMVSKVSL